jgi:hypothetical protein
MLKSQLDDWRELSASDSRLREELQQVREVILPEIASRADR